MKTKILALLLALLCLTTMVLAAEKPGGDGNIGGEIFDDDPIVLPWSMTVTDRQTGDKTHTAALRITGQNQAIAILAAYDGSGRLLTTDLSYVDLTTGTAAPTLSVTAAEPIESTTLFLLDAAYIPVADAILWNVR